MVYLLWAYVIIWAMLLIYIYTLIRKTQNLGKDINALREILLIARLKGKDLAGIIRSKVEG